jgi:hypothetical protein
MKRIERSICTVHYADGWLIRQLLAIANLAEVKRQRYIIAVLAAVLLSAGCVWLVMARSPTPKWVTLTLLPNHSLPSSNQVSFCVSNTGPLAILLTDVVVELRAGSAWRALNHTVPTHPQRLATGDTKDLVVAVPHVGGEWRLRVIYGKDVKGPLLFLAKAEYSISHLRLTGPGFGVMAGRYSCVSDELSK